MCYIHEYMQWYSHLLFLGLRFSPHLTFSSIILNNYGTVNFFHFKIILHLEFKSIDPLRNCKDGVHYICTSVVLECIHHVPQFVVLLFILSEPSGIARSSSACNNGTGTAVPSCLVFMFVITMQF
jgi:hypothetical protein